MYITFLVLFVTVCGGAESFRLPNTTIPTHYDLYLDTNFHEGVYNYYGTVKIDINVLEDTKQIVLHSSRNTVLDLKLKNHVQLPISVVKYEIIIEKEFLVVNMASVLKKGIQVVLEIDFLNSIERNDQAGFYRTWHTNDDGVEKLAGVTQFQPCDARSAFPCYDEPGIKATFDVRIACGVDYHARSNAEISSVGILPEGKKLVTFKKSPAMQTYLLAFLVSDYAVQRDYAKSVKKITVQSMVRPAYADQMGFALDASVKLIDELQTYFDHPYEMSKLDSVGIKDTDFSAGAMENWGLVTYLESLFLISESSSESRKRNVATVISHELAHQFFGNLLAPEWWSYLWLNEGFATLYEYYLSDRTHPELLIKERFPAEALQTALQTDASATVRPMTHYVETVYEIDRLFDRIAYDKSGSVLRMMQYALGESTFVKGLKLYIKKHQNSVVEPQNLYDSLQSAAVEDGALPPGSSITRILESWSSQPGAPVVTVKRTPGSEEITFSQTRFFTVPQSENNQTWWIPIFIYTNSSAGQHEKTPLFWMPQGTMEMTYNIPTTQEDVLMVNSAQTGYYRVNYDPETWRKLIDILHSNPAKLNQFAKSQLIDDSMNLAHADLLDHGTSFKILDYLRNSTEFLPWKSAYRNILDLEKMLASDPGALKLLRQYLEVLTNKLFTTYGLEERRGENADDHDARLIAIDLTCRMGQHQCMNYATTKMNIVRQRAHLLVIQTETEQRWYCNGLRTARQAEIDLFREALQAEKDSLGRLYLIDTLSCVVDRKLLKQIMESLAGGVGSSRDLARFLTNTAYYSETGLAAVIDFLHKNKSIIDDRLGGKRSVEKLLYKLASRIADRTNAAKLLQLVKGLRIPSALEQNISAQMDEQIRWQERNVHLVRQTLEKHL